MIQILATLAAAAEAYVGWTGGMYGAWRGMTPYAGLPMSYAATPLPFASVAMPIAVAPKAISASKQMMAADELGQYKYGYSDANSAKKEVKTADGVVRGSYSYIDANGIEQKVNYVADGLGFRVAATNLPRVKRSRV